MKKILNNQWVVVIGGGLIVLLLWKYLLPILPEGRTALKFVLVVLGYLLTYGVVLFHVFWVYNKSELNKKFVLDMILDCIVIMIYLIVEAYVWGYTGKPILVFFFLD
ncbi:MAG: hypothetical protein L3J34_06575 [Flavobacteriaceae bacterium]|nr:hypothetical protein [Flavobacteriaceae bacterium]